MGKITELRRMCHRYDRMKLAVLLILCAVFFAVSAITSFVGYFSETSKPVEYILVSRTPIDMSDRAIATIKALPDFVAVSPQVTTEATISHGENTVLIRVYSLSSEYLAAGYGIDGTKDVFYLGKTDYSKLTENNKNAGITYSDSESNAKTARIEYCDKVINAVALASSADFTPECCSLRAMFSKTDITGTTTKALQNLGFAVENEDTITELIHTEELTFVKFKYSAIIVLLSTAFACVLIKNTREIRKNNTA